MIKILKIITDCEKICVYFICVLLLTAACQNSPSSQTRHYHWIGGEGEEIIMTQRGDVFRGEYVDPGFQERASVPVAGIIDKEGNVRGTGFDIEDGSLYAQFTGKITGSTFEANWNPLPNVISEFRSWNLKQQKLSPEEEREIAKHPDTFFNRLFPELELCTSHSIALNRVIPFLPEETAVAGGRLYGYQIGEWETRRLRITPATKAGEVDFHLQIESNGQFWIEVNMKGTARLTANSFRFRQKNYEFEVAVYNGFATITTITGFIDLSAQEDVNEGTNKVDDATEFTLDGVYPLLPKGFVDKRFYEINFYCDKDALGSAGGNNMNMEETITKDILALPEMQFPNAAIMIVDEPTADQPWFTVKAGSNRNDHFATSYWFRVYTAPEYEIRIYDIVLDSEMTLAEWRDSKPVFDED